MGNMDDMNRNYHMDMKLAEAYVPMQIYGDTFDLRTALNYGTLFPELYRPYPRRPAA
ncbi:spore coat associated protein CotJA [Biomaibacter acetigenes]|jgi:hypothetical protein|uniref:Spore coat associated protein CotJA n=1 Tax=Biomaibacter acetigenes TaxID=2316383 RepID=A0A3G2R6B8_9FIRM|nr:spore coat associated protein CotJA [Biomaibacter acetigenes]AYO30992.1 spore coat associated protein CotJA [Biomaibacter acetigenes]RKL63932.1 spore coat associated protein CotJA [Thermoanaerobacteraceae bacterium SP2]